jgi:hypothetical protein
MSERIVPARNGMFTLYRDGQAIHSRYDPVREAEKYADSLDGRSSRCFLLLEPGLGYVIPFLRKRFPGAGIIVLHCSAFLCREENAALLPKISGEPVPLSWNPEAEQALEDFLEDNLAGLETNQIRLVEWRPAAAAYGGIFIDILGRTVEVLKRLNANRATVRAFGRRWLRNALRNLTVMRNFARAGRARSSLAVCASGPGLEQDLGALSAWKASRSPPLIAAVSSAVPCLVRAGLFPDIVVGTDGGNWALLHLIECIRVLPGAARPLFVLALSAAVPSELSERPVLILSDGSLWQRTLLAAFKVPFLVFPQRGTVSATALDLAFFLAGSVCVSGLDFRHRDLVTHARPYAFDRLREESACRLSPAYSLAFVRELTIRSSVSLPVYRSWFRRELPRYRGRLFALGNNDLGIPLWTDTNCAENGNGEWYATETAPVPVRSAAACLAAALGDPFTGKPLRAELEELLGGEGMETADIENELRTTLWTDTNYGQKIFV